MARFAKPGLALVLQCRKRDLLFRPQAQRAWRDQGVLVRGQVVEFDDGLNAAREVIDVR